MGKEAQIKPHKLKVIEAPHNDSGTWMWPIAALYAKVIGMVSIDDDLAIQELQDKEPWFIIHLSGIVGSYYIAYDAVEEYYYFLRTFRQESLPPVGSYRLKEITYKVAFFNPTSIRKYLSTMDKIIIQKAIDDYLIKGG